MAILATFYDHIVEIAKQEGISAEEALQEAKKLGVRQVEVSLSNARGQAKELARQLAGVGMGISAVPCFFDFSGPAEVDDQIQEALALARTLGAARLLVIPGFTKGSPAEVEAQTRQMLAGTARLGELAGKDGIGLVMEDFDNSAAPFSTSGGMLRFMDACPGLAACFDTGNFRYMAEDIFAAYEALRGRINHVHLKDRAYAPTYGQHGPTGVDGQTLYPCPVGSGEMPVASIIARLQADGYDGTYTIEHYDAARMLACLQQSAAWVLERI